MSERLQIAIISTAVGVLLSLPLGLAAARNLAPAPLAWASRGLIVAFRTFHPVIVAILFVKAVGFGALAGMLALVVASLGFLSARSLFGRVSARLDSETAKALPLYAEGMALLGNWLKAIPEENA